MTCQILTKEDAAVNGCAFQEWNKDKKDMCSCGKTAIAKVATNMVCMEHLPDALMRCGHGAYLGMKTGKKGIHPIQYDFKEDFLNACKKENELRCIEKEPAVV